MLKTQTQQKTINELFVLPVGMEHVITLDGIKLYGSSKLNRKFIKAIERTGRGKKIVPTLDKMIQRGTFVPAFASKNIFTLIKQKVFPGEGQKGLVAFYHPGHKIVVICLGENVKWGFTSNDWIARLAIHESMHKCSFENSSMFLSTFKSELADYYFALFNRLFSLGERPKEMDKIVRFIYRNVELSKPRSNSTISKYYKFLINTFKGYSNLSGENFEKIVRDFIVTWKVYTIAPNLLARNLDKYIHIIGPIAHSYKDVYGSSIQQNFYTQEIAIPSEVIAIRSEIKTDAKIYKAFSTLK